MIISDFLISSTVGGFVIGAANSGDTTIGGHDHNGGHVTFKRAVEVRETLNVEHMHLIDEEHTGNDLSLAFLTPLCNLFEN